MTSPHQAFTGWLAAVMVLVGGSAAAQDTRGTIRGVVVAPAGAPLPTVTLVLTNPAGIDRRVVSEPTGEFVLGGLQPGVYRLRLDAADLFAPWSQDNLAVTAGGTLTVRVELQPRVPVEAPPTQRGAIAGTITGPNGNPLGGAVTILVNPQGIERRAVSEPSGAYVFGGLLPGSYRLRVDTSGMEAAADVIDVALTAGEQRQVDVRLQPVLSLRETPPARGEEPVREGGDAKPEPPIITVNAPPLTTGPGEEFEAKPDRWQFSYPAYRRYAPDQGLPFVDGGPFDPYNQNTAKGDFPITGSTFLNLNLQGNSNFNPRRVSGGTSPNGSQDQLFYNQNIVAGVELFGGSTVFEPKRWAVRGTLVVNYNALAANSFSFGNLSGSLANPKVGVEELFVEKRLGVRSLAFDFVSLRAGMQNFNADFRGFLFADNQLGVRLFGNGRSNRDQFNIAYFSMRTREPGSQLHDFTNRNQDVVIGNYYIQDAGGAGYTLMVGGALNRDRGPIEGAGTLNAMYAGLHGDGRWGSWAVSHAYYEAFGSDDGILGTPVDIRARMAAIELARDADWLRYRFSALYASGDDAADSTVTGFDSITDNPNFAGGQFMFWTQQAMKVPSGARDVLVSEKFSLLPSLRSKFTDRANFANPGLVLLNGGVDMRMSPTLKVVSNASWLRFADASMLRTLGGASPGFEDEEIGLDLSAGAKWRPALNENLFVLPGVSVLMPRGGFATALGSDAPLFSVFAAIQVAY